MALRDGGDHSLRLQGIPIAPLVDQGEWENVGLSPSTQQKFGLLLSSVQSGKAHIEMDNEGKILVKYLNEKEITLKHVDKSKAHTIQQVKDTADVQLKVNVCLEMIEAIKQQRAPAGVNLDPTRITLGGAGQYREGVEFHYLQDYLLGKGNCAGGISVAIDKATDTRHAVKKVLISEFRPEEVRAWFRLNDSDSVPKLYLFRLEDNKVVMHMEEIVGVTLQQIIDEHMATLGTTEPDLVRPFSLCLFHDLLAVVQEMHDANWAHDDLHGGNVMLKSDTMSVKVLDFGRARPLKQELEFNHRALKDDILNALRLFCGVYIGCDFENNTCLEKKINNKTLHEFLQAMTSLSQEQREELMQLVTLTYQVTQNQQQEGYGDVRVVMENIQEVVYRQTQKSMQQVLRMTAAYLFPDRYNDLSLHSKKSVDVTDGEAEEEEELLDLDAVAAAIPEDFLVQFQMLL